MLLGSDSKKMKRYTCGQKIKKWRKSETKHKRIVA